MAKGDESDLFFLCPPPGLELSHLTRCSPFLPRQSLPAPSLNIHHTVGQLSLDLQEMVAQSASPLIIPLTTATEMKSWGDLSNPFLSVKSLKKRGGEWKRASLSAEQTD